MDIANGVALQGDGRIVAWDWRSFPEFLDAVESHVGLTYLVTVSAETRCWLQHPRTEDKTYMYKGEVRSKRVLVGSDTSPCTVAAVAAGKHIFAEKPVAVDPAGVRSVLASATSALSVAAPKPRRTWRRVGPMASTTAAVTA